MIQEKDLNFIADSLKKYFSETVFVTIEFDRVYIKAIHKGYGFRYSIEMFFFHEIIQAGLLEAWCEELIYRFTEMYVKLLGDTFNEIMKELPHESWTEFKLDTIYFYVRRGRYKVEESYTLQRFEYFTSVRKPYDFLREIKEKLISKISYADRKRQFI